MLLRVVAKMQNANAGMSKISKNGLFAPILEAGEFPNANVQGDYRVHRPLRRFPMGYMTRADMNRPTVMPIAIWIMLAATLNTYWGG